MGWLKILGVALLLAVAAGALTLWWIAWGFERSIRERTELVRATSAAGRERIDLLPLLRAFVERSLVQHPGRLRWVRLEQRGEMRLAADGPWMPLEAVQVNAVAAPAFVWHAAVRMAPGLRAVVIDGLTGGEGILEARLLGAIPVAKSGGPETLKGELQRMLAELPWNPAAIAANPAIRWQQVDGRSVSATIALSGVTATVLLRFDEAGDIVEASATDRPLGGQGGAVPTPWRGTFSDYRVVDGLRVPTRAVVAWDLPSGRFEYWRGEVVAVSWE